MRYDDDNFWGWNAAHIDVWETKVTGRGLPKISVVARAVEILGPGSPETQRLFSGWGSAQGTIDQMVKQACLAGP